MPEVAEQPAELVDGEPLTTKNARTFAEHNRAMGRAKANTAPPAEKTDHPAPAAETQVVPPNKSTPPAGEKREPSESAPAADTGKENQSQEKTKPHEEPGIKARLSELAQKRRAAEEERDALKRELEELRKSGTRKPEESTAPKPEEAKPAEDAEPDFQTFYNEEEKSGKHQSWAAVQAAALKRYNAAMRDFSTKQGEKATRERQAQEQQRSANEKLVKARAKYQDFDQVTAGDPATGEGLLLHNGVLSAMISADDGLDILYEAGKLPAEEKKRIAALPPQSQLFEMAKIQARLANASQKLPEKDKPAVTAQTRTPAPPAVVNGAGNTGLTTGTAKNMREHNLARGRKDGTTAGA